MSKTQAAFLLAAALWAPQAAHAQVPEAAPVDAGEPVKAAVAAEPGHEPPGDVARHSGLDADAGTPAPLPAEAPPAPPKLAVDPKPAPADKAPEPNPDDEVQGKIGAWARLVFSPTSRYQIDSAGTTLQNLPFETRLRVTPEVHFKGFGFLAEADAATGAVVGGPPADLVSDRVPVRPFQPIELRQLYLQYKWASGVFRVGQQASSWGLGLLANPGSKDPEPPDFGMVRYGSLTWRALLAARPFYGLGGAWRAIEPVLAADLIVDDNFARFLDGDRAFQGVAALRFAKDADNNLGIYAVVRSQRREGVTDGGRATDVVVIDVAGKWQLFKRADRVFDVGFEFVTLNGQTTQARNENADVLTVRQFGAVVKVAYKAPRGGFSFDWGYASGDQNPSDGLLQNMRFDRDYKVGLVLFDEVLAHHSARAAVRASDPGLVGVPPEGVDLLGTRASVSGAWYLFPRVRLAPADWVDLYGGPLFAFGTAKLTDPYETRLQGGTSRNALGAVPGDYLGTELDVGAQLRWSPHPKVKITGTLEAGLFLPGDAFLQPDGSLMPPVGLGRVKLAVNL